MCGSCVSKLVSGQIDNSWQCELDDGNVLSAEQMAVSLRLIPPTACLFCATLLCRKLGNPGAGRTPPALGFAAYPAVQS